MFDRAILDRVMRVWNSGDAKTAGEIYSDQVVWRSTGLPEPLRGRDALLQYVAEMRRAFPDLQLRFDDIVAEGEKVAVLWSWTGTHKDDWRGIAPTGRRVTQTGLTLARMEGGRIVEEFVALDRYNVLQQLGVLPPDPTQTRASGR